MGNPNYQILIKSEILSDTGGSSRVDPLVERAVEVVHEFVD